MKTLKTILVLLIMSMLINIIPIKAASRTVKVAYPIQSGLTEIDEDGLYSGYTYEYLKEISRFTNWNLEFVRLEGTVNEQLSSAMEKVKTGEIDLMGGMLYIDTLINDYDYSATNYGMGNMAIYVNSNNAEINDTSIYSLKNLNVGVVSTKKETNVNLKDFGDINGININQIFFDNTPDLLTSLERNEIDAMVLSDLSIEEGNYRVVARFSPRPFYFVMTKGNQELMSELNEAMTQLNKEQPNYMSNLHERYFSLANRNFILTEAEKGFVANNSKIDVLILGGKAPIQYYDEKKGKVVGITVDVLNYIGKLSGLKFNYIYANDIDEYNKQIETKKPMIIGGVYNSNPEKYITTKAYLDSAMTLVTNKNINANELDGKQAAMIYDSEVDSAAVGDSSNKVNYYGTQLECIKAVENGTADYTYINNHVALFYNSNYDFKNINIIPQGNLRNQGSYFAINTGVADELLDIINKGIDVVSYSKIEETIFTNASTSENDVTFFDYVENNQLQVATFTLMAVAIIVLFFLIWRNYINKRNNEKILSEYKRYQQISEFSHDCFVEYNIATDTLVLMGGGAKLLSKETIIKDFLKRPISNKDTLEMSLRNLTECESEEFVKFIDGKKRWLKINLRPIFDLNNKPTHIIGKVIDIHSEKEEQLLWRELAQKDSLTKIYNSAACREKAEEFLQNNTAAQVALIIIDIDNFKYINDTYGHLCGDIVLQKIAQALLEVSHPLDIFGRVGGDEFLTLIKYPKSIEKVAEYCQNMIKSTSKVESQGTRIITSISVGAVVSSVSLSYDELYRLADDALYRVKNNGRNNYCIIDYDKENTSS